MAKQKGGRKLARSSKKKGQYAQQFFRTAANKARQAARRVRDAEYWLARPHQIGLSRRAIWRARLFGFKEHQLAKTAIRLP